MQGIKDRVLVAFGNLKAKSVQDAQDITGFAL